MFNSESNLPAQYERRYSSCESLTRMFLFYRVCQYSWQVTLNLQKMIYIIDSGFNLRQRESIYDDKGTPFLKSGGVLYFLI